MQTQQLELKESQLLKIHNYLCINVNRMFLENRFSVTNKNLPKYIIIVDVTKAKYKFLAKSDVSPITACHSIGINLFKTNADNTRNMHGIISRDYAIIANFNRIPAKRSIHLKQGSYTVG